MIKKILAFAFLILVIWFFIENPTLFIEFSKFSSEKIKGLNNGITGNAVVELNDNVNVSAGVEANITIS